ncbi:MAG: phenylalanine--tRNA ligase subunit alpha [Patescibacteria group bacterium]
MKEQLERILIEANQIRDRIKNSHELEDFRVKFLGRKGILKDCLDKIVEFEEEERKNLGKYLNFIKNEVEKIVEDLEIKFKEIKTTKFDFRHPGKKPLIGNLHLISISFEKIKKIFMGLGFSVADSSEIVNEYECFDSLNIPSSHPARDLQDTLWVDSSNSRLKNNLLFRTQTSAHQVKFMKENKPPFRIIIPGKVFRQEATDRSHDFEFHQLEGLAVAENANLTELKGIFEKFFSEFFEEKLKVRFRPGYFPFVEPGLEVDLGCLFCAGKGCLTCKNSGFIEVAGAGMVHPVVLENGGINSKENYGYAFGFGLNRIIMLKYKIDDIRLFHSSDLRFIKQFN